MILKNSKQVPVIIMIIIKSFKVILGNNTNACQIFKYLGKQLHAEKALSEDEK